VRAVPQMQIVLGPETTAEGRIFRGVEEDDAAPIGWVRVALEPIGSLTLQSTSAEALLEVSNALLNAGLALVDAIETKKSAREGRDPGADALGEAGAFPAEGERSGGPAAVTSYGGTSTADLVAAPPSNLKDLVNVAEASVRCWADESQVCTCRNGNDCVRRPAWSLGGNRGGEA
jgi:hypothetical protein